MMCGEMMKCYELMLHEIGGCLATADADAATDIN
jgi:hypothetical protein